jgi:hypothetical protein
MARKQSRSKGMKMQPAITDLYFKADPKDDNDHRMYIDTMRELSKVNRRMYSQAMLVGYQGMTFIWKQRAANPVSVLELKVATAGNTWSVQNAHVKGHALWNQMQDLVLEDNPSIKGKWHDFKIQYSSSQSANRTLACRDAAGVLINSGEWNIATYVMPQHEVDTTVPGIGTPLPALELTPVLIGDDTPTKRSLVKAYQESRATVQPEDPSVPGTVATSFFNLLTDSGSQEPELADVIIAENDEPPYDQSEYVGGANNGEHGSVVAYGAISAAEVDGRLGGFVAPCGLLELQLRGFDATGEEIPSGSMPEVEVILHVAPGSYKGVAAIPMGQ